MSKNFELLQQIGSDEELFRTSGQPTDVAGRANSEPGHDLDKEARERILQNASLPNVFQTSRVPADPISAVSSELSPGLNEENGTRVLQDNSPATAFRTSRNPASAIGSVTPATSPEVGRRGQPRAPQSVALPEVSPRTRRARSSPVIASPGLPPGREKKVQEKASQGSSPALRWVDSIKAEAKSWRWRVQAQNNHHGFDLEAIAREEEIKLAQRVFPGTGQDAPRVVLFSGLENEAGCASICARTGEILAARAEGPVCIVDANFRSPSLHEYFGVENLKGLVDATLESGPIQNFVQQIPEPDLWLMPSGKAAAKLSFPAISDGLRVRIKELRHTFRYVVIHSGPLRLETSAMLLSRWTDGVVLVVEANSTRRESAKRVKENLAASNVNVLGVVLNNRIFPIPEAIYRRL